MVSTVICVYFVSKNYASILEKYGRITEEKGVAFRDVLEIDTEGGKN